MSETATDTQDILQVRISLGKTEEGKIIQKTFRVTGQEYQIMHNQIVPKDSTREEGDVLLTRWVRKEFPYSNNYLKTQNRNFDQYATFIDLAKAIESREIDGVACNNMAAVLFGLATKGQLQNDDYYYVLFTDQETKRSHATVYDRQIRKFVDPQAGVVTFEELKRKYGYAPEFTFNKMAVAIPGPDGFAKMIKTTNILTKPQN